jgi:CRP-like cAMP-binding protein
LHQDYLIAKVDPGLLNGNIRHSIYDFTSQIHSIDEERSYVVRLLMRRCPGEERQLIERFATYLSREIYQEGAILWRQGAKSNCAKLLVSGDLVATLENEAGTWEAVSVGSVIGESGLVERQNRNSTVTARVESVLYSLSLQSWELMKENDPKCANLLYAITVRYLMLRVQHCSNRIFETRCLPV